MDGADSVCASHNHNCAVFFIIFCQKFRKLLDPKDSDSYSITRICLPKCEKEEDGQEYTECCSEDRCNGARSTAVTASLSLVTLLALAGLVVLRSS